MDKGSEYKRPKNLESVGNRLQKHLNGPVKLPEYEINVCDHCGHEYSYKPIEGYGELVCSGCAEVLGLIKDEEPQDDYYED